MGAQALSSRAIIGALAKTIEETAEASWIGEVSMFNGNANQEIENYRFLGNTAKMREWSGPRQAKGLQDFGVLVASKEYEDTLEVKRRELYLDKTSQVMLRVNELAVGARRHWAQLLSPLLANGATSAATYGTTATYDGVNFFGNTHRESQSNLVASSAANPARPTTSEMMTSILQCIETFYSFIDEQKEPINEGLSGIRVIAPTKYLGPLSGALNAMTVVSSGGSVTDNVLRSIEGVTVRGSINQRLDAGLGAANKMVVCRADSAIKPFIRQEEEGLVIDAIAEGSEEEVKNNRHLYGVRATRGVGYGRWEHALLVTFS